MTKWVIGNPPLAATHTRRFPPGALDFLAYWRRPLGVAFLFISRLTCAFIGSTRVRIDDGPWLLLHIDTTQAMLEACVTWTKISANHLSRKLPEADMKAQRGMHPRLLEC